MMFRTPITMKLSIQMVACISFIFYSCVMNQEEKQIKKRLCDYKHELESKEKHGDLWLMFSNDYRKKHPQEGIVDEDRKRELRWLAEDMRKKGSKLECKVTKIQRFDDTHRIVSYKEKWMFKWPFPPIWCTVPHEHWRPFEGCLVFENNNWFIDLPEHCGLKWKYLDKKGYVIE